MYSRTHASRRAPSWARYNTAMPRRVRLQEQHGRAVTLRIGHFLTWIASPATGDCAAAAVPSSVGLKAKLRELAEDECSICLEAESDVVTRCGHVYHRGCIEKHIDANALAVCPLCRAAVRKIELLEAPPVVPPPGHDQAAGAGGGGATQPLSGVAGAKVAALVECAEAMAADDKLVVFSSFTKFLDLCRAGW